MAPVNSGTFDKCRSAILPRLYPVLFLFSNLRFKHKNEEQVKLVSGTQF